ncbi:MAG: hypothetical protein GY799_04920 [Desulfobulbaceae bacterium]|nr:hypothetical protein [Desulfobulbaceae bacterium]
MKLLELYKEKIMGAISGLDRIRFRGSFCWLATHSGMNKFLSNHSILLKDFKAWVMERTANIRQDCDQQADHLGIETIYLNRSGINKEEKARQIAEKNGIEQGPICNFSVLERCYAPQVKGNKKTKKIELKMLPSKCIHLYHYFNHAEYGFGHVRLQTWAPFNIFICLNGRHWLERQLQKTGMAYHKDGNCFPWIEDIQAAQRLFEHQLKTNWNKVLDGLVGQMCPGLAKAILPLRADYYWSADETEWATDIMFNSVDELDELYPHFLYHGIKTSDSASVMRYFGRRRDGGLLPPEVISDYRRRYEGIRIKHWRNNNSIKMYNKAGSILRIETTINNPRDFKVFRRPNDDENRKPSWQMMRKGVSDLHRRCQVSNDCNERYGDALAAGQVEEKLKEVLSPACNKKKRNGKKYRGLNPWQAEDYKLLTFLTKGEHAISGFRNKDLRKWLYPKSDQLAKKEQNKYAGRTTRRIKLLRIHGLIKKVAKENRYALTAKGQKFASALMSASSIDIKGLTEMAA